MKEELSRRFHENLEEHHWWFAARRKIILDQLDRLTKKEQKINILDIGCATGVLINACSIGPNCWFLSRGEQFQVVGTIH